MHRGYTCTCPAHTEKALRAAGGPVRGSPWLMVPVSSVFLSVEVVCAHPQADDSGPCSDSWPLWDFRHLEGCLYCFPEPTKPRGLLYSLLNNFLLQTPLLLLRGQHLPGAASVCSHLPLPPHPEGQGPRLSDSALTGSWVAASWAITKGAAGKEGKQVPRHQRHRYSPPHLPWHWSCTRLALHPLLFPLPTWLASPHTTGWWQGYKCTLDPAWKNEKCSQLSTRHILSSLSVFLSFNSNKNLWGRYKYSHFIGQKIYDNLREMKLLIHPGRNNKMTNGTLTLLTHQTLFWVFNP